MISVSLLVLTLSVACLPLFATCQSQVVVIIAEAANCPFSTSLLSQETLGILGGGVSLAAVVGPSSGLCVDPPLGSSLSLMTLESYLMVNSSGQNWDVNLTCSLSGQVGTGACGATVQCNYYGSGAANTCINLQPSPTLSFYSSYSAEVLPVQPGTLTMHYATSSTCASLADSSVPPETVQSGQCGSLLSGSLFALLVNVGNNRVVYSVCDDAACILCPGTIGVANIGQCFQIDGSNWVINPGGSASSRLFASEPLTIGIAIATASAIYAALN